MTKTNSHYSGGSNNCPYHFEVYSKYLKLWLLDHTMGNHPHSIGVLLGSLPRWVGTPQVVSDCSGNLLMKIAEVVVPWEAIPAGFGSCMHTPRRPGAFGRACYLGCLKEASKSLQVLLHGIQAVLVLTLIILR